MRNGLGPLISVIPSIAFSAVPNEVRDPYHYEAAWVQMVLKEVTRRSALSTIPSEAREPYCYKTARVRIGVPRFARDQNSCDQQPTTTSPTSFPGSTSRATCDPTRPSHHCLRKNAHSSAAWEKFQLVFFPYRPSHERPRNHRAKPLHCEHAVDRQPKNAIC